MVEAGDGDAADVVIVQRSVKWREQTKSLSIQQGEKPLLNLYFWKSFVALMLLCSIFSNPPPPPLLSPFFFVASPQEYKTSFHADGKPSHLPRTHTYTAMDPSMHTCMHIQAWSHCPSLYFEKHIIHTPEHISLEPWASAAARQSV